MIGRGTLARTRRSADGRHGDDHSRPERHLQESAPPDDADDANMPLEQLRVDRRAHLRHRARRGRRDVQSGDRHVGAQGRHRHVAAASRQPAPRASHRHRGHHRLEARRGAVGQGRTAPRTDLRDASRTQRAPLHPDGSPFLPRQRCNPRAGAQVRPAGPEHDREDPGDPGWDRGDRGGDLPGHQHQRNGLLHPSAMHRGRRGRRARPPATRAGGQEHRVRWGRSARSWWAGSTTGSRW